MRFATAITLTTTAVALSGCITGGTRVTNKTSHQLSLKATDAHTFQTAVLDRDGDTLVVFGNIHHQHENKCRKQCYIVLQITSRDCKVLRTVGIPIVHRGTQRRGWFGASFRLKLPFKMPTGASVALIVRDRGCRAGPYFELDGNTPPRRCPPSRK
jgi:hypothetical protein